MIRLKSFGLFNPLHGALPHQFGHAGPGPGAAGVAVLAVIGGEKLRHVGGKPAVSPLQNGRHELHITGSGARGCIFFGVPTGRHAAFFRFLRVAQGRARRTPAENNPPWRGGYSLKFRYISGLTRALRPRSRRRMVQAWRRPRQRVCQQRTTAWPALCQTERASRLRPAWWCRRALSSERRLSWLSRA
jgi:hypothetical protein